TIPSGIFHPATQNVIGNGVIIDPLILYRELDKLRSAGMTPEENLLVSRRAHLILPSHRLLDSALESLKGVAKIGSTLKGIGPTYTDKYGRNGIRVGNILEPDFSSRYHQLKESHIGLIRNLGFDYTVCLLDGMSFEAYEAQWVESVNRMKTLNITDSEIFINKSLDEGRSVLAEGAQGTMLDVDFGAYPFVTSSNTISAGVCAGLGISPQRIGKVFGIFKAYCTRVGSGPFPTELHDSDGDNMRREGNEFGSTTGRPRRCGWLDLPALKYAIMLNGVNSLIMMKADVLNQFPVIKICTDYQMNNEVMDTYPFEPGDEQLQLLFREMKGWEGSLTNCRSIAEIPAELSDYIGFIEKAVGLPIEIISIGPDRLETLQR
ncbi:MAG: adenylosuccinate synthase, partial [Bacteroidota bacterium]